MKRVVLMAVVLLAIPIAASASSFDIVNQGGTITGAMAGLTGSPTVTGFGGIRGSNLRALTFTTGAFTSGDLRAGGFLAATGTFHNNYHIVGKGFARPAWHAFRARAGDDRDDDDGEEDDNENEMVIPEPSTLGLLGTGLLGIAGLVRRKLSALK